MSGGHFDYKQYGIGYIADKVEQLIYSNDGYSVETVEEFKKGLYYLKMAQIYAQRIDWLVSSDDSEDSFHKRLAKDLAEVKNERIY